MADAEVALAEMMMNGGGGQRDPFTARVLLEKAAQRGHVGALSVLNTDREDGSRRSRT
jgi:TPR repeat protein